jgi:eukaryotic-like serine/threonine-protein kinase
MVDSDDDRRVQSGTRLGMPTPGRTPEPRTTGTNTVMPSFVPGLRVHQYELIRELGKGGMGFVYAARDVKLGRRVAIKFLKETDREVRERFLIEARATAQCNHENIVVIHEVGEWQAVPFMVLEYLEGLTLRDLTGPFQHGTRMPGARVVEIALQIARALARAHERGVVHRDLKPENVVVTAAGPIKVLDFGIAKALGTRDPASTGRRGENKDLQLTQVGSMLGTLPYMAPEQMRSATQQLDHRADLWALGIIMFELLSGRHPIDTLDTTMMVTNTVLDDPHPSIGSVVDGLPDGLVRLVDQLLRKKREDRIPSATELVRRLEALQPGRPGRTLEDGESPYVGLGTFQETDADRFFGRNRDIIRMVGRVRALALTAVIGPSGVGKSSFVRAGVAPALKATGEMWEVLSLRPGRHAMSTLASTVQRAMFAASDRDGGEQQFLAERMRAEPGYLGELLRERAQQINGKLLLLVDQFEDTRSYPTRPSGAPSRRRSRASPTIRPPRCASCCRCARTSSIGSPRTRGSPKSSRRGWSSSRRRMRTVCAKRWSRRSRWPAIASRPMRWSTRWSPRSAPPRAPCRSCSSPPRSCGRSAIARRNS